MPAPDPSFSGVAAARQTTPRRREGKGKWNGEREKKEREKEKERISKRKTGDTEQAGEAEWGKRMLFRML